MQNDQMRDWDEDGAEEPRRAARPRRAQPAKSSGGSNRILIVIFGVLLVLSTIAAVALFSGVLSSSGRQTQTAAAAMPPSQQATPVAANPAGGATAEAPQLRMVKDAAYGDWAYRCIENPQDQQVRCFILQQVANQENNRTVFLWRISQDGKGGLASVWQAPGGVLLSRGITLDAGTEKPIVIPFQNCAQGICQAVAGLAPDFLETLSKTEKAVATVYMQNGNGVNLTMSVNGLKDGLAQLQKPFAP